jgi:hypothetical protein
MVTVTNKEIYTEVMATKDMVARLVTRVSLHEKILWALGGGFATTIVIIIAHVGGA